MFKNLKTKNIHIVGVSGAEGSAVLEFLEKNGAKNIIAHDFSDNLEDLRKNFFKTHLWLKKTERLEAFEKLFKIPAKINLKNNYLRGILKADMIFAPSSWRLHKPNFPLLREAVKKGIEFSSITKLYFDLAKGKIISVTGTKGKGTTARLIYEILSNIAASREVFLAGNDRRSAQELEKISRMKKEDILILETSNRQLITDLGRSPDIGIITNISPDHIDEHGSFEKYIETKKSLFKYSKNGDIAVLNYDNAITKKTGEELSQRKIDVYPPTLKLKNEKFVNNSGYQQVLNVQGDNSNSKGGGVYFFSRKEKLKKGAFVENGKIYFKKEAGNHVSKLEVCDLADIKLIGEHNIENVLAAVLAGHLAGATPKEIKSAVSKFSGLPHRLEFIGEYGGAKFYDDSASTNPESTVAAIKAMVSQKSPPMADPPEAEKVPLNSFRVSKSQKLFLISGGEDKGMEYEGLAKEIIDKVDTLILLPGSGSEKLTDEFKIQNSKFKITIQNAKLFIEALDFIDKNKKAGDMVLISPACAHFQVRYIDILKKPIRNLIVEKFR